MINISTLRSAIANYNEPDYLLKEQIHKLSKKYLKELAKVLKLVPGSFTISSCKGGPAVSGEAILHHDSFYMMLSADAINSGSGIMYRLCNGRKDYIGGPNHWTSLENCEKNLEDFMYKINVIEGKW